MAELVTIHMPLTDEGTEVWRPVIAERLDSENLRVIGPMPIDEKWAFAPGSVVRIAPKRFADGTAGMVAIEAV
jgi:hypothetical protein